MAAADSARKMALILGACASLAGGGLLVREGWVLKGTNDPVVGAKLPTACAGVTEGVVLGKTYTESQCIQMTLNALVKHAGPIADCLPDSPPFPSEGYVAEQIDTAFNLGVTTYLKSSMCTRMRAGDLAGACEAITLYRYAGGADCSALGNRTCRGVWLRRLDEHDKCLKALS